MTIQLAVLAVVAGALSIASPCVLPLLPAYVGVLSSSAGPEGSKRLLVRSAVSFVVGFSIVFVALGAVASSVGQLLRGRVDVLTRVAGAVMVVMGVLIVAGSSRAGFGSRYAVVVAGVAERVPRCRTAALGASVAIGWTPCIGPVLTSVLALSASTATAYEGAAALALYSAGLAVPFIALAVGLERAGRLRRVLLRRGALVERLGGVLLVTVGVGYLSGWWTTVWVDVQGWLARTGWPPL